MDPLTTVTTRATAQREQADERQIPNSAGGFAFALGNDTRVQRFLTLGTERTGIDAKLVVVGMTANDVSIADPEDRGMIDVAGFDSAVPTLIADFSRGTV